MLTTVLSLLCSLLCCVGSIAVIAGAIYFFVFRKGGDADSDEAGAVDALTAKPPAKSAAKPAAAPAREEDVGEDDATVVASVPEGAPTARPPRTSGATIIAFDDDEL